MFKKAIATIIMMAIVLMGMAGCSSQTLTTVKEAEKETEVSNLSVEDLKSRCDGITFEIKGDNYRLYYELKDDKNVRGGKILEVGVTDAESVTLQIAGNNETTRISGNMEIVESDTSSATLAIDDSGDYTIIPEEGKVYFDEEEVSKVEVHIDTSRRTE